MAYDLDITYPLVGHILVSNENGTICPQFDIKRVESVSINTASPSKSENQFSDNVRNQVTELVSGVRVNTIIRDEIQKAMFNRYERVCDYDVAEIEKKIQPFLEQHPEKSFEVDLPINQWLRAGNYFTLSFIARVTLSFQFTIDENQNMSIVYKTGALRHVHPQLDCEQVSETVYLTQENKEILRHFNVFSHVDELGDPVTPISIPETDWERAELTQDLEALIIPELKPKLREVMLDACQVQFNEQFPTLSSCVKIVYK